MRKIQNVDLSSLKNAETCAYFNQVEDLIKAIYGTEICREAASFLEASQAFELTLQGCSRDEAVSLQAVDEAADEAWCALSVQLSASLRHPNMEKKKAAAAIFEVFSKFSDPTRLNYDEEYELIREQIEALRKFSPEMLKNALIDEHLDALEACRAQFMDALTSAKDGFKRPALNKKAREAAREAYRQFVETMNVMVRISTDPRYAAVVDGINELVKKLDGCTR